MHRPLACFALLLAAGILGLQAVVMFPAHAQEVVRVPFQPAPPFIGWVPDAFVLVLDEATRATLQVGESAQGRPQVNVASLQRLMVEQGVQRLSRQFPGARPQKPGSGRPDLTGHYKVQLEPSASLDAAVAAFAADPHVESVERIGIHTLHATPNDPYYQNSPNPNFPYDQWHYWDTHSIHVNQAWDTQTGDASVVVGILDSGVRYFHVDLGGNSPQWGPANPFTGGNIFINGNEIANNGVDDDGNGFIDDTIGWDFVSSAGGAGVTCTDQDCSGVDNDPDDGAGHGTHVAGTVGAMTNNNRIVAGVAGGFSNGATTGTGNGVEVLPLRIGYRARYQGQDTGIVRMDWAAEAMAYVADLVDAGVNVTAINCSWGSSNSGGLGAAVDALVARDVLVVHSAGNSGSNAADYLGGRTDVMNVAATDVNGNGASFTNYGTWVDVAAPGVTILSTYRNPDDTNPANHYLALLDGTSMASPHITGIAALLESCNPALTATQKFSLIVNNTDPYTDARYLGTGIANAAEAIAAAQCGATCDLVANFGVLPDSGCAPLPVGFTDLSTGTGIVQWSWDFGDGGTSTQQNPFHLYTAPGNYTVQLIVSDGSCADTLEVVDPVQVLGAPVATFAAAPDSGCAPLLVSFTDLSTGGGITDWGWDFGDGGTSTLQNPSHTYTDPGSYAVRLVVSNGSCADTLEVAAQVQVSGTAPVAAFSADSLAGAAPMLVSFSDESSGTPTAWNWDFGDGNGSAEQHPTHTYQDAGTYTVMLVATNACGEDSLVQVDYLQVDPPTSVPFDLAARGAASLAWPNPVSPATQIAFRLEQATRIEIVIYDVSGRPVRHLVSRRFEPGAHALPFDGTGDRGQRLASGLYFYRFVAGDRVETRKLVVSR